MEERLVPAVIWVATILCARAICERVLAALMSMRELPGAGIEGPRGWEKWGLGRFIKHVRREGWVPDDLMDEVEVLCEARKPYGHFRYPFDAGTIGRRVAEALAEAGWDADPILLRGTGAVANDFAIRRHSNASVLRRLWTRTLRPS